MGGTCDVEKDVNAFVFLNNRTNNGPKVRLYRNVALYK